MFNKSSKNETSGIRTIITVVLFIISILALIGSKLGLLSVSNIQKPDIKEYKSIEKTLSGLTYEVKLPAFILDKADKAKVKGVVTNNTFADILIDDTILSLSPFQSYEYDPLNINSTIENSGNTYSAEEHKYKVANNANNIEYISYKVDVPTLENCTIINWADNEVNYGIIIGEEWDKAKVLESFSIEDKDIEIYSDKTNSTNEDKDIVETDDSIKTIKTTHIELQSTVELGAVEIEDTNTVVYSIDNSNVMAIIYGDGAKDSKDFKEKNVTTEKILSDTLVVRYSTKNPFDKGTESYDNYEKFIDTIDSIIESIVYME